MVSTDGVNTVQLWRSIHEITEGLYEYIRKQKYKRIKKQVIISPWSTSMVLILGREYFA